MTRTTLCFLAAASSVGCFSYVPTSLEVVPFGTHIRALVSTEAQVRLRDSAGLDARELTGALVDREGDRLLIQVRTGTGSPEFGSQSLYQRIALRPSDVLRVDARRVSVVRTGLFALAIAGAAVFVAVEALGALSPGTPEPPPGGGSDRITGW